MEKLLELAPDSDSVLQEADRDSLITLCSDEVERLGEAQAARTTIKIQLSDVLDVTVNLADAAGSSSPDVAVVDNLRGDILNLRDEAGVQLAQLVELPDGRTLKLWESIRKNLEAVIDCRVKTEKRLRKALAHLA